MNSIPDRPKIYHITHLSNLSQILGQGRIWSDAKRIDLQVNCQLVGMSKIKRRRLETLPVKTYPDTTVGQYVPFYLCPRSIMLFILHCSDHPDLTYRDGQTPIVHLAADLRNTVEWARQNRKRWAFTTGNAGTAYTDFYSNLDDLGRIDWSAVAATNWRDPAVQECKQAEFLVHESFPWQLVERIGVIDKRMKLQVDAILKPATYQPPVSVETTWYY